MTQEKAAPQLTTLVYLEKDDALLMLHRVTKKNDENHDRWIGVGGHLEYGESPLECALRETREETGLVPSDLTERGVVTFLSEKGSYEIMFLFTAREFAGRPHACSEGYLEWVKIRDIGKLNLWEGDRVFFRLLAEDAPHFLLKLVYDTEDRLKEADLNGEKLELFDVLSEDGTPSGIRRERGVCHRDGSLHGTVHIWIARRRRDGGFDLLLQKRSENKDCYPGCWDISSAGHIPAGETPEESVKRELSEELGLSAQEGEITRIGDFRISFDEVFHGQPFCDREIAGLYVWKKDLDPEALHLQKDEIDEVSWFPMETCFSMAEDRSLARNCLVREELEKVRAYLEKSE